MRCLVLADALLAQGAQCHFLCRAHAGHLTDLITARGHQVSLLAAPTPGGADDERSYAAWLGAAFEDDAEETLACLGRFGRPDWLVVDHYGIDARWQTRVRAGVGRLAVIDDLADRRHDCDLLLDQNWLGPDQEDRYQNLVPPEARQCLGPAYALLKPEYAQLRPWRPPHDGLVRRLLVFFGGSDPDDLTSRALHALSAPEFDHWVLDVVLGPNHPNMAGVTRLAQARPGTVLHRPLPSLAGLMLRADLMLGAGGSTNWERMCLGLPTVVISIAENQMLVNESLFKAGYIDFLGAHEEVTVEAIRVRLQFIAKNHGLLKRISSLGMELVPGHGAALVSDLFLR